MKLKVEYFFSYVDQVITGCSKGFPNILAGQVELPRRGGLRHEGADRDRQGDGDQRAGTAVRMDPPQNTDQVGD